VALRALTEIITFFVFSSFRAFVMKFHRDTIATRNPQTESAGLYIHVPFCVRKCPYCDFYSITDLSLITAYLSALKKEMQTVSHGHNRFDTIYIGGGTPSVLSSSQIADLLDHAARHFPLAADVEITIEVNPGTTDQDRLKGYFQAGIHRINIGIQSFNSKFLSFLKRIHSRDQARQVVAYARNAGFENLGIDLIYGIPGQNDSIWRQDLETAVAFSPEHLSCYLLSYEHGTPMEKALSDNQFEPLAEETTARLFELTHVYLQDSGYVHYEISNFAKKNCPGNTSTPAGYRSRHNMKYWTFAPYTGLGPSAHSFSAPIRSWNHADVRRYIACLDMGTIPIQGKEALTQTQQMMEAIYLGLRTAEGMDIPWFEKQFQIDFQKRFSDALADMVSRGWVTVAQGRCALTLKGMLLLDGIAARLIDEIENDR